MKAVISFLTDALRTDPIKRYTAFDLKTKRSLMGLAAPTVNLRDMHKHVATIATNITNLQSSMDKMSLDLQSHFYSMHLELDKISAENALGLVNNTSNIKTFLTILGYSVFVITICLIIIYFKFRGTEEFHCTKQGNSIINNSRCN